MRYRQPLTIPMRLARGAGALDRQIADGIADAVGRGLLAPGARMPSTRTLAAALGVSRGVATAAYEDLCARGRLVARHGSGTYVTGTHPVPPPAVRTGAVIDMTPGPAATAFPLAAWRAAWRVAGLHQPPGGPPPPLGLPDLRDALATHLVRTRGLVLHGYQVVVTDGTTHALSALLTVLVPGGARVGLDEVVPPWLHRVVAGHARPVARPTGQDCAAVVATPDGAAPLGRVLPATRRAAMLRWAARTGGCLISVDQGAAFTRHEALLCAGGHAGTVLLGDFTDLFTPALRIGYAVLPTRLADDYAGLVDGRDGSPSWVDQRALAHLLRTGAVERAMHRAAQARNRHDRYVRHALGRHGTVRTAIAGTVLLHPAGWSPDRVAAGAAARGVRVPRLADYHWHRRDTPDALVIGYGHLAEAPLCRALTVLTRVIGGSTTGSQPYRPTTGVRVRPAPPVDVR